MLCSNLQFSSIPLFSMFAYYSYIYPHLYRSSQPLFIIFIIREIIVIADFNALCNRTAPMQATLDLPPYQTDPDYKNSHRVLSPTLIPISDLVIINATAPDSVIAGTSVCIRGSSLLLFSISFLLLSFFDFLQVFNLSIQNLGPSDAYDTHVQLALPDGMSLSFLNHSLANAQQ